MSGWRRAPSRPRTPVDPAAWSLALTMARDAWRDLGGDEDTDASRSAILAAAVGLVGHAGAILRAESAGQRSAVRVRADGAADQQTDGEWGGGPE